MIFTTQCPSCEATFPIDAAKVPAGGVYARCSQCDGIFLVEIPAEAPASVESTPEAAPTPEPAVVDEPVPVGEPEAADDPMEAPQAVAEEPAPAETMEATPPVAEEVAEPVAEEPVAEFDPPTPPPSPAPAAAPTFGKRDPNERAQRLARVLVSDMIAYHPDRHRRSLEGGTLKADFEEEIEKSWNEYVEQVGKELAESTGYFTEALNEILAKGQPVFS